MFGPLPRLLALCAVVALVGCDPVDTGVDTAPVVADCTPDEELVNWENWGAGFFAGYCRTCHSAGSAQRYGAPEGVDFDTPDDVRTFRDAIERSVLEVGTMPVGGGLPDAELPQLATFLACGL